MKIENIIWLAGLFEGEGTTGLFKGLRVEPNKKGQQWRIYSYWLVCNNDAVIIDRVNEIAKSLGVNLSIITREREGDKNHNTNYQVGTKKMGDTYKMLEALFPHLVGQKKYVAKLTMEFLKSREFGKVRSGTGYTYSEQDWKLLEECKQYNQRGIDKKKFESSEAIRLALQKLGGDDMVRTSMKVGECILPKEYE